MTEFVERIARFGPGASLIGVVTAPKLVPGKPSNEDTVALVLLNTGITHRPGHHRIFVQWARMLASAGFATLRFDFSGIGDSAGSSRLVDSIADAKLDLQDALDLMQASGYTRFVLLGICSGADSAIVYAGEDRRIAGVVLIDPTIPALASLLAARWRLLSRYVSIRAMLQIPAMIVRQVRTAVGREPRTARLWTGPLAQTEPKQIRAFLHCAYADAIGGGVHILALLTSDTATRHSAATGFARAFPGLCFGQLLSVVFLDEADHLLVRTRDRARVLAAVRAWLPSLRSNG